MNQLLHVKQTLEQSIYDGVKAIRYAVKEGNYSVAYSIDQQNIGKLYSIALLEQALANEGIEYTPFNVKRK